MSVAIALPSVVGGGESITQQQSAPPPQPTVAADGRVSPSDSTTTAASNGGAAMDGMRREWNFRLTLSHMSAKAELRLVPQWATNLIPTEIIERILREGGGGGGGGDGGASPPAIDAQSISPARHHAYGVGLAKEGGAAATSSDAAANSSGSQQQQPPGPLIPWYSYTDKTLSTAGGGDSWEEAKKEVMCFYNVLPSPMSLEKYCINAVQQVLAYNPTIISVDGASNLARLKIGRKITGHSDKLGGQPSFVFRFATHGTAYRKAEFGIVIGTCVEHRGYVIVLRCEKESDLEAYYRSVFIRHFRDASKVLLNQNISYTAECTNAMMRDAQRLFGELRYYDVDAALSFAFAMHPMAIRPDFSPTQTVGVGSIACMTFEMDVYQRVELDLLEENDSPIKATASSAVGLGRSGIGYRGLSVSGGAAVAGGDSLLPAAGSELITVDMGRFKPASAVLFVDVELVAKQGYPTSMSINQYLQLKLKRLLETFKDAKLVGETQNGQLGPRLSRSQHVTFTYEGNPEQVGVVKALMTCTLVGNHGITAMYFTRLTQGLFDHHLYLYQHLTRSFRFYGEGDLRGPFSRFETRHKARLTEVELSKAYPPSVAVNPVKEAHLRAIHAQSDGTWEGATVYVVDPISMVCVRKDAAADGGAVEDRKLSRADENNEPNSPVAATAAAAVAAGKGAAKESVTDSPSVSVPNNFEALDDPTPIPVSAIPHLANLAARAEEDEAEEEKETRAGDGAEGGADDDANSRRDEASARATPSLTATTGVVSGGERTESPQPHGGAADDQLTSHRHSAADTLANEEASPAAASPSDAAPAAANSNGDGAPAASEGSSVSGFSTSASPPPPAAATDKFPPPPKSSAIVEEVLATEDALYFGPSLRDVYCRCCEQVSCRPNSYLFNKLPRSSRFTEAIEELDLSSNYLGHHGFQAILNFLEYLPKIQTLIFNDMSLDNEDIRNLCECLEKNPTVKAIHLKSNPKVSLPATKYLTRLIKVNPRIATLQLTGTSLGEGLIKRIEADAASNTNTNK